LAKAGAASQRPFFDFFSSLAPYALIDGDPNRSTTSWPKRGGMPFTIADEKEGAYQACAYGCFISQIDKSRTR